MNMTKNVIPTVSASGGICPNLNPQDYKLTGQLLSPASMCPKGPCRISRWKVPVADRVGQIRRVGMQTLPSPNRLFIMIHVINNKIDIMISNVQRSMATYSSVPPGESPQGQRSLSHCDHGSCKESEAVTATCFAHMQVSKSIWQRKFCSRQTLWFHQGMMGCIL